MKINLLVACVLLICLPPAWPGEAEASARERMAQERASIEAGYARRELECQERFAVNRCLDQAKVERRQGLNRLRQEELILERNRRKREAARRSEEISAKRSVDVLERGPRLGVPVSGVVLSRPPHAADGTDAAPPMPIMSKPLPNVRKSRSRPPHISHKQEYLNRAAFKAKQAQAKAHEAEAVRRQSERAARHGETRSLPVPPEAAFGQ